LTIFFTKKILICLRPSHRLGRKHYAFGLSVCLCVRTHVTCVPGRSHFRPVGQLPFILQFSSQKCHVFLLSIADVDVCRGHAVDASMAGWGNLEITINDGHVPCHVTQRTGSVFHASFTPRDAAVHYVAITFNGAKVPGITCVRVGITISEVGGSESPQPMTRRNSTAFQNRISDCRAHETASFSHH